ncbi:MAG: mechanosensitive ion channel family protein [Actinomycetota bacterium]
MTELSVNSAALAVGFLVGSIVLGWIVYRIVAARVRHSETATSWGGNSIIVSAVHDVVLTWFTVAGAYAAVQALPLQSNVAHIAERILLIIVIISATLVAGRLAGDAVKLYSLKTAGVIRSSSIFVNITRVVVFVVGALILLQTLGISIAPILTALGVGGLAIALALQDTFANLFAGLHIIASKKVAPGDFVRLDSGDQGYVLDINWRNTTLRQLPNNVVIVPNLRLSTAIVTNFYQPERQTSATLDIGVAYDSDLASVERVTIDVAREVMREVPGGVPQFDPFIRYHTFGDHSIRFTVVLRSIESSSEDAIKHEFVKRLHERYKREGIEIPIPVQTVHLRDAGARPNHPVSPGE